MDPSTFVLFGSTGNLAKRKIYPALFNLYIDRKLTPYFSLIGLGRRELSDTSSIIEKSIRQFSKRENFALIEDFLNKCCYSVLEIGSKEDYKKLLHLIVQREVKHRILQNRLFYLSVGPEFFGTITVNIEESALGSTMGWKRLVIEKPFGHDLQSARYLKGQRKSGLL